MNLIVCWELGGAASWKIARKMSASKVGTTVPFYLNPWHAIINRPLEDAGENCSKYIDFINFYGLEESINKINNIDSIDDIRSLISNLCAQWTEEDMQTFSKSVNVDGYMLQDLTGRSYLGKVGQEDFFKYIYLISKYIEDVLDDQKPNCVFDLSTDSFMRVLLSLHCKKRKIRYRSLVHSCFMNQVFVTDYLNFTPSMGVNFTDSDMDKALRALSDFSSLPTTMRVAELRDEEKVNTGGIKKFFINSIKNMIFTLRTSLRKRHKFLFKLDISPALMNCINPNTWRALTSNLMCNTRELIRNSMPKKKFNLDGRPFYYVPLSYFVEALDPFFCGECFGETVQMNMLRGFVPLDSALLVKDHRAMLGERTFADERLLSAIPSCKFLSTGGYERKNLEPRNLIEKSQGVIVLQGTSGLEAAIFGKPLLVLGSPVYKKFIFSESVLQKTSPQDFFLQPKRYVCKIEAVQKYIALCFKIGADINLDFVLEASSKGIQEIEHDIDNAVELLSEGIGL